MPQTLLALAALSIAGYLSLSQNEAVHSTTDSVIRDQFELTVAGTLLHTMEFADARAFDEATTPAALRDRYGLPEEMTRAHRDTITYDDLHDIVAADFAQASAFGGVVCDVEEPWKSERCDDVDDFDGGAWQEVVFETADAAPLAVEVRAQVDYVEADAPDVPVSHRTFHKRVEVHARTTEIKGPRGEPRPVEVTLRRVISFDPVVAAEYLRRSIRVVDVCEDKAWETQLGLLQAALNAAREVQVSASASVGTAQGDLADAEADAETAAEAEATAGEVVAQRYWDGYDRRRERWRSNGHRDAFYEARDAYYEARAAAAAAAAAVGPAQSALTAAESAADAAQQQVAQAEAALLGHQADRPSCG